MTLGMYVAVAAGGALGAVARYSVSVAVGAGIFGLAGPTATLLVNIAGSALMGLFAGIMAAGFMVPEVWRGFLAVGFLGALTTFSSFALDAGNLIQKQGVGMAALYIGASVVLSLLAFGMVYALCTMAMRGAQ